MKTRLSQTTATISREVLRGIRAEAESEDAVQQRVITALRDRAAPGVLYWHCPNGGQRSGRQGALFKRMGVLPGVSDLHICLPDGRFGFLELKKLNGKAATEEQITFLAAMVLRGHMAGVAYGFDAAILFLEAWGALRS